MKEWRKPQLRELGANKTEFVGPNGPTGLACLPCLYALLFCKKPSEPVNEDPES